MWLSSFPSTIFLLFLRLQSTVVLSGVLLHAVQLIALCCLTESRWYRSVSSEAENLIFLKFIYLFLAALYLHCCARAFSSCGELGLLFVAVRGLLFAMASRVAEHGLWACGLQELWLACSRAQAQ